MRPRLTKKDKLRSEAELSYAPRAGPSYPNHLSRAAAAPAERPLVFLPGGRTLTQNLVPPLPGQVGFNGDRPQDGRARAPPLPDAHTTMGSRADDPPFIIIDSDSTLVNQRHRRKKRAQWLRWQEDIIPRLLPNFLELFHVTQSFRNLDDHALTELACTCGEERKTSKVVVLRFLCKSFLKP